MCKFPFFSRLIFKIFFLQGEINFWRNFLNIISFPIKYVFRFIEFLYDVWPRWTHVSSYWLVQTKRVVCYRLRLLLLEKWSIHLWLICRWLYAWMHNSNGGKDWLTSKVIYPRCWYFRGKMNKNKNLRRIRKARRKKADWITLWDLPTLGRLRFSGPIETTKSKIGAIQERFVTCNYIL